MGRPIETLLPGFFHAVGCRPDGGLRRSVHVVNFALEGLAKMVDEGSGHRLASQQHLLERAQRGKRACVQRQHARQRRSHLQMRHTVAGNLIGNRACTLVAVDDDLEAAGQGPQQFQHRDVEGNTGDGEPDSGLTADRPIHAGKEVDHVPVLDHHPLGLAGRAGGIDHVGQVAAGRMGDDRLRAVFGDGGIVDIENSKAAQLHWKALARSRGGEEYRHP